MLPTCGWAGIPNSCHPRANSLWLGSRRADYPPAVLIGRDREVGTVLDLVRRGNSCALVGEAGIGKTAVLHAVRCGARPRGHARRRGAAPAVDALPRAAARVRHHADRHPRRGHRRGHHRPARPRPARRRPPLGRPRHARAPARARARGRDRGDRSHQRRRLRHRARGRGGARFGAAHRAAPG